MNFDDNKEQEKILTKALKAAYEFVDSANKLNSQYQEKLKLMLLDKTGIKIFTELMEKMK